ncbi:MAG: T9SS type A sorting domain-containing protein [Paludibacter sp.]|nr:T9SS type A sorting domain-containing protein [Paludibacter sp.]
MKKITLPLFLVLFSTIFIFAGKRQMEYLNRGTVAIKISSGVYISWRLLGTEDKTTAFNVYRNNILVNQSPLTSSTNLIDSNGTVDDSYQVKAVINGVEDTTGSPVVKPWAKFYKTIKLNRPANGKTEPNKYGSVGKAAQGSFSNGQTYTYSPNDCGVGDVDGDGEYEIIVKWDPSNSQDNSYYGLTGNVYLDAYKLDGTQLWRIDLGKNIRAGAHYTQFMVYDFDGDGLAEIVCKTAPGTIDGKGNYVIMNEDDPNADYRSKDTTQIKGSKMLGTVLNGPEYLTLFDGGTGEELNSVPYEPERGSLSNWGDTYGNRSERYLACVAYLDGVWPSVVMCRGYYARTTLCAYDVVDKKLIKRWLYDSGTTSGIGAYEQGNHNLSVADVDADGKDEVIYGSCAIDNDGTLLYRTGLGHGDAMHVSDLNPDRDGLEVWDVHEDTSSAYGYEMHDAANGTILWGAYLGSDNGRGLAADIDARYRGFEMWSTGGSGTYSCTGTQISTKRPSVNFRIYWDGDLQDELLDGTTISKWSGNGTSNLLSASSYGNATSNNSTKQTPCLSADILGDWREELILFSKTDSASLMIYTTTTLTTNKLFTLMHDPIYRLGIAWQNVAYNQPPHLGFYIGDGLDNVSMPDIETVKYNTNTGVENPTNRKMVIYQTNGFMKVKSPDIIRNVALYNVLGRLIYSDQNINSQEFEMKLPVQNIIYIIKIETDNYSKTQKLLY